MLIVNRTAEWCVVPNARNYGTPFSFPFVKDGPVNSMLKEIRKDALKHLFLAFGDFEPLFSCPPLRYLRVISLSEELS